MNVVTPIHQIENEIVEISQQSENNLLFVSWAPHCSRSDSIAKRLGGRSIMVYSPFWGSNYVTAPIKYLVQTLRTFWILVSNRPKVVFVMAPPVIVCIPVWIYCRLFQAQFVIDAHTGAFLHPRWEKLIFIQKFFSRRAKTNIVTNRHLKGLVESWNAHTTIITDVPVDFVEPRNMKLPAGRNMTMIASFCPDEPIEAFLDAATRSPDVTFHVTGNYNKCDADLLQQKPANVHFLGFLSDQEYVGQLLASDAVIALTTRDHTMQRGAYEAIYLGKPVITSNFEVLRDSFPKGTVHVQPIADSISSGIHSMIEHLPHNEREAHSLRDDKIQNWNERAKAICEMLNIPKPIPLNEEYYATFD